VFSDLNSETITLKSRKSGRGVMMEFSGFKLFGIWSAANDGPYVALEPWTGCATAFSESDEFTEKRGMRTLEAGETEKFAFTVFSI
jgi:galactose mutarotase-like enzyme